MKRLYVNLLQWFSKQHYTSQRSRAKKTRRFDSLEALEVRTMLAAHPLADVPDVQYQVEEDWGSGRTASLTLFNDEATAFTDWQLEFDYGGEIQSLWNAEVENLGGGRYRITPPNWDNTLDVGESLSVGFVAVGPNSEPTGFAFQGSGTPGDPDDPDPEVGAPNQPSVSVLTDIGSAGFRVTLNLWAGDPADHWKLYENGELIYEASLSGNGTPQTDSLLITDRDYGVFRYQVEVSNASGATQSDEVAYVAGDASLISIVGVDGTEQALQATIDQATVEYTLASSSESAQFSVATSNSQIIHAEIINGNTLRITGLDAGRASVRITDIDSGEDRFIGVRVRTDEGQLPGLPDYVTIGSVSEDTTGDLEFWQDFDSNDPLTNKYVDSRYIYLNGGPINGWQSWDPDRVSSYLRESLKLGMIPQFVYYNIPDGGESYTRNLEHINSQSYMENYFRDLKFVVDTIRTEAGDELVQMILEPDFIGYLMQNADAPASTITAMTSAAYSSGVLQAGVDPQFDNSVTGLIQAINYTINNSAPNVEFGWQFNLWASTGIEAPIPGTGIVHLTDTLGINAGRTAIAREAELIAQYYMEAGVLSYGADFISLDKYGLDAGAQNGAASNPESSTWFWNNDHWHNYLLIVQTLTETTEREMVLWQLPVGHINDSLAANPYDESGTFDPLTNTTREYEDSAPTFFLGDTFTATGDRLEYFSSNEFSDDKLTVSGNTITWGSHIEEARAAGVRQILFGAGVGISTDSIGSDPSDDYWWITKVQEYYQNPVPLDVVVDPPDDVKPVVRIGGATITEGDSGSVLATLTVSLSEPATESVTVNYQTSNGTATAGEDYEAASGQVSFAVGETTKTITVRIFGDTQVESDEEFYVTLSSPVGAILDGSLSVATNTIANDDVPSPTDPVSTTPVVTDPVVTTPVATDPVPETGNFNAVFNVISDWGSGFTGEVAVQNLGSETLKGWEVSFDFGGDINSIWNGAVVNQSGSRYTVRGALWNPDISSGVTVTFGFNGTPGGAQAALENFVVMGIHDGPQPIAPSPVVPMPLPMPEPTPVVDPVDGQGNVFTISPSSSDIVGFNPSKDRLDFGDVSVHNLIVGKTESGEVAIVNPWAWSPELQVLSGVAFNDLTAENFGVVVNEHLRQDIGGVLSWELGVGSRDANTVYVRSHEYSVQERIENFDPATTKLSFLYFGTRERLSVDDTDEGLLISVEPTGQSVLLVGVAKSDLVPSNIEFHHDQIVEDQLEVPFGYTVDQVTMVSRSALATPEAPAGELTDGFQTSPGSIAPHDGHDHGGMPMPMDPVVTDPVVADPVVPVMPPMDGHDGHDDMPMDDHDGHDHMAPPASSGEFIDITAYGTFHDSNNNSHNHELVGGRTAITTEAMDAYNNLRAFLGLSASTIDDVGEWAFAEQLTNNADPYGNDIQSVGLWYAMQGAKVGWIAQDKYDPQILADIQRTARLGDPADVMSMVREVGISGYADYLEQYGVADTFISTLKMEPHYGGVMHGRTHGYLSIEGVAINHDVNHLTVLSWDQSQPFMNDTFDWPQWPALDVSDSGVMEYYQSMVVLGDPVGLNMESVSAPVAPPVVPTEPVVADPVVTDPSASPIANYDKVLAAYFPEWGIYGRDYQLADVPADELTHLIYAFADLNAAGEMTLFDSYAATEKRFSAEESVTGEADQWYYPPEDPRSEQTIWGNFNQLALLKEANPHLTLSIAVGGWTLSDHFSTVTSTQAGRDTFSDSIVEFLTTYQVFDGIDFDWEYPGGGGESGNSASPNDGANYALLMTDVRAKLDDLGSELGRTYEISIASPAGLDKIANFNLAGLALSVDFFNVMTYDFHGTWEGTTGHQAAFTGDPVGYDIETSVDAYLNAGVAPEQIVLGAPLYTRAWSGVSDGGDGGYNEASSGAAPGTYEAGNYDYKDLLSQINAGAGWDLYWDDNAQASYVYNAGQDIFSSFETTTSIALKAEWADAMGLGGMMFWDLSNDATDSPDSLISAAFRSMVLEEDLADIQSDSSLPDPIIVGGDGEIGPLTL